MAHVAARYIAPPLEVHGSAQIIELLALGSVREASAAAAELADVAAHLRATLRRRGVAEGGTPDEATAPARGVMPRRS